MSRVEEDVICAIIKEHLSDVLWGHFFFFMSTQESVTEFVTSGSVKEFTR